MALNLAQAAREQPSDVSLDFDRFQAITFDCYGTLIDWETGLLGALQAILNAHGQNVTDEQILKIYGELEPPAQNPYKRYRAVLADVVRGFADRLKFQVSDAEAESLANSIRSWQPFPDTVGALKKLKTKYRLAVISNIDDDLFASTAPRLQVEFDEVITAQQAKAYKPSPTPFRIALGRLDLSPNEVLHAGQSVYHDVLPAKALGIATVLVHRRGCGATRPTAGEPDLKVPDVQTLASLAVKAP